MSDPFFFSSQHCPECGENIPIILFPRFVPGKSIHLRNCKNCKWEGDVKELIWKEHPEKESYIKSKEIVVETDSQKQMRLWEEQKRAWEKK